MNNCKLLITVLMCVGRGQQYTENTLLCYGYNRLLLGFIGLYYLLGKGGYVFGSVDLSVCLFVNNTTEKVMNGLG